MNATHEIPDEELNLLVNSVDAPISRANRGDITAGHDELLHGLQCAEAARDDGEAWGADLVGHWQPVLTMTTARSMCDRRSFVCDRAHPPLVAGGIDVRKVELRANNNSLGCLSRGEVI